LKRMNSKTSDWQTTVAKYDVHTKRGKERFLNEVASWYERMYPARADFFKRSLRNQREVTNPHAEYKDEKGRQYLVKMRVPTELWMFIKRWIPEFGDESADIELLTRVWCDLVRPARERRRITRIA
jgi:hypothetical protein